jgi:hypothetical protein
MTREERAVLVRLTRAHAELVEARKISLLGNTTSLRCAFSDIGDAIDFAESAIEWLPPEKARKK